MPSLTYEDSGVSIRAGERAVQKIAPLVRSTLSAEVLTSLGGYSGLYALSKKIKEPILVASTDGVGTKLSIAAMMNRHDTIGVDLVAMSVNDIIVSGATPLFFLDYFATGKLSPDNLKQVVKGIVKGCHQAGCALIGGETAEMPGFYQNEQYDLAGFAVGVVEKKQRIDGKKIKPGHLLVGLASSGLHSNGYTLARKIVFEKMGLTVNDPLTGFKKGVRPLRGVGNVLLTPTLIYAKSFLSVMQKIPIYGAAHITGGGMTRNIPRILPEHCMAKVFRGSYGVPEIFNVLQKEGEVDQEEMYSTFNMGIGMVFVVDPQNAAPTISILKAVRQKAFIIGEVIKGTKGIIYG
jgi:phosphoribosylformylglycinamidine cyclo-ligase